jgi:hypothetical protein
VLSVLTLPQRRAAPAFAARMDRRVRQAIACSMEIGVHNSALAFRRRHGQCGVQHADRNGG